MGVYVAHSITEMEFIYVKLSYRYLRDGLPRSCYFEIPSRRSKPESPRRHNHNFGTTIFYRLRIVNFFPITYGFSFQFPET